MSHKEMVEDDGFEPPNSERADLQSAVFSHFTNPPDNRDPTKRINFFVVKSQMARDGIEPPTRGFSVLCSTD
jgi:hypothetical protein